MDISDKKSIPKRVKFVAIAFLVAVIFLQAWKLYWPVIDLRLKNEPLHVLHARNLYQQYKGLGGRDSLGSYDGMLFMFDGAAKHGIVMRDMRFPIDIVWLYGDTVVDIAPNVPTEPGVSEEALRRYYPRADATLVLELPSGWAQEHDLKIGDRLSLEAD